jgi:hypothetical protein
VLIAIFVNGGVAFPKPTLHPTLFGGSCFSFGLCSRSLSAKPQLHPFFWGVASTLSWVFITSVPDGGVLKRLFGQGRATKPPNFGLSTILLSWRHSRRHRASKNEGFS